MSAPELESCLESWALEAAAIARRYYRRTGDLHFKSGQEAVTEADGMIEARLRELILARFPDDLIVGEEMGGPGQDEIHPRDRVWHLDPIDGTLNFALGLPGFCTSLALMQGDDILAACVHQPVTGDTFLALRGQGARLNGTPIAVSCRQHLSEAVMSAQFKKDGLLVSTPELLQALFRKTMKVRKTGAIALELAWTAAGFYDVLLAGFRGKIQLYDVAAGLLLVQEAGGLVSDFAGHDYQPEGPELLAGNGSIQAELVALLDSYR